jgi:hypothetical protein
MSGFALYFERISYADSATMKSYTATELKAFASGIPGLNIDTAIAELRVEEKLLSSGKPYEWTPSSIQFRTKNNLQHLYVVLVTSSTHNSKPRFHLHGATSEFPDKYPMKVQHKPVGEFVDLPRFLAFPKDTDMIKIWFDMPGHQPTNPFKFDVIAWDNATSEDVPCDPQVGNEPP